MAKKKIAIMALIVVLAASITISGTLAYLTSTDTVQNVFTLGDVEVDFDEPGWHPDPADPGYDPAYPGTPDGEDMVPGNTYVKDPTVTATEGDSYMRIKVEFLDEAGIRITDPVRIAKIWATVRYDAAGTTLTKGSPSTWAVINALPNFNATEFVLDTTRTSDVAVRYYNYINGGTSDVFEEGTVSILFTNIAIASDWGNSDFTTLGGKYTVQLTVEAIQANNIAGAAAAYTQMDTEFPL